MNILVPHGTSIFLPANLFSVAYYICRKRLNPFKYQQKEDKNTDKKLLNETQKHRKMGPWVPVISEMRDKFESLKLFKDEDLTSPAKSVFGFTPSWINYKEPGSSDEFLNAMRWYCPNTLAHFIATYESRRKEDPTFSMTNFKRIGPRKAKKILDVLYGLSNGLYDPEPELRTIDSISLDIVKRNIRFAESLGVKKSEILKIVDDIYDKQ